MRCLVTGATGIVGSEVLAQLSARPGWQVVGVSRRSCDATRVFEWRMGAEPPPSHLLGVPWDVVVHTAADTRWNRPPADAHTANVISTEALRHVVGPDTRLVHLSTAYAAGLRDDGRNPDLGAYRNTYEWSKAAAERHVSSTYPDAVTIRPPLLIGRRSDGEIARFNGLYSLLTAMTSGHLVALVATPGSPMDVVPVDDLARLIVRCTVDRDVTGTVRIGCGPGAPMVADVVTEVVGSLNSWRAERGVPAITAPPLIGPAAWERFHLPFIRPHLTSGQRLMISLFSEFEPYMSLPGSSSPVDVVIPDPTPALRTCVRWWANACSRVASHDPAPWHLLSDDETAPAR